MAVLIAESSLLDSFDGPPDVLEYFSNRLSKRLKPFPTPASLLMTESEFGTPDVCPQITFLSQLCDRMCPTSALTDVRSRAHSAVQFLVENSLGHEWIADLPASLSLPILELIRVCQVAPAPGWSKEVYNMVGRPDLGLQVDPSPIVLHHSAPEVSSVSRLSLTIAANPNRL